MRRAIVWLTLLCFCAQQTAAYAGPHEEGEAAGRAANADLRGMVREDSARAVVPGYTAAPPQAGLAGAVDLNAAGRDELAACAARPGDPVCEAQTGATASAATPRPAVLPNEASIAAGQAIQRDPGAELGDLAAWYSGCAGDHCTPGRFCLGESCFDVTHPDDPDFARVATFMEAAREAGVYLDTANLLVFRGVANRCRNGLLRNCCKTDGAGAGFANQSLFGLGSRFVYDILFNADNRDFIRQGFNALLTGAGLNASFTTYGITFAFNGVALPAGSVVLHAGHNFVVAFDPWSLAISVVLLALPALMACNQEEGLLAMKKGAALCRDIGTYCSRCIRVFGKCVKCIEHTTVSCCFNSRLARMINEQGRAQVGRGWGEARNPDCSGFTVAELQRLDFAAMDLSEFYASIVPTLPDLGRFQGAAVERIPSCYFGQGRCR